MADANLPDRAQILSIRDASAGYGRTLVLHNISIELRAGEILAVVGPNGSGKSSLLKLALGVLAAEGGEIAWFGRSSRDWPRRALARRVAYLPQSSSALPGQTVADVLASGRSPYWGLFGIESAADRQAAAAAADLIGIRDWLHRDIATLSGGQRQRVFIGRCVTQIFNHGAQDPAAILLDEPDTYLDLRHTAELAALLLSLAHKHEMAILLASHDLNLAAEVADRMALLSAGRTAATGAPADVLTPERVGEVYQTQVEVFERHGRPVVLPAPR